LLLSLIIFICTDRRAKGSNFLVKLFSIGVYNALLGQDRVKSEVCRLINKPRIKKEAKMYYGIDSDDAQYDQSSDSEVTELEINNIRKHFKTLGKNTEKYADSFNNIAVQYNPAKYDNEGNLIFDPQEYKYVLDKDNKYSIANKFEFSGDTYAYIKTPYTNSDEVLNIEMKPAENYYINK
jgi:hypothetical protein